MYLISPKKNQYKANLHSHTVLSDGHKTPEELKELYKSHGYSVLSITDHEIPKNHSYLNDPDFLTITGYEAYLRPNADARYDVYATEIHLNLFARQPENEKLICYNPAFCKYLPLEKHDELDKFGSCELRGYTVEYINKFIATAKEAGYIVSYNHPHWSMEDESRIMSYEGLFSIEMSNYSSRLLNQGEYNAQLYDKLLSRGQKIFCHSTDDNHNTYPLESPRSDSFGGFAMILSDELSYDAIFSAMEKGEMYSSMGPLFKEVSVEGNKIHIECSEVSRITVFTGSKSPKSEIAPFGETITSADFEIDDRAKFVRVSILDKNGNYADTRGFLRDELDF